jgi:hypothetical protein
LLGHLGSARVLVSSETLETRAVFMPEYAYTSYFEREVLRKRPYLKREWCVFAIENAVRSERQEENRWRFWAPIDDLGGRYLRVVTLEDKNTIHNAFPDRGFKP